MGSGYAGWGSGERSEGVVVPTTTRSSSCWPQLQTRSQASLPPGSGLLLSGMFCPDWRYVLGPRLCGLQLFATLKTFIPSLCLRFFEERMVTLKIFLEGVFAGGGDGSSFTHIWICNYAVRIIIENSTTVSHQASYYAMN